MSDRHVALLVIAVWAGALVPLTGFGGGIWVAGPVVVAAWRNRWPAVLIAGAMLLASLAAAAAWGRIDAPQTGSFSGEVVLLADPVPVPGGVRVVGSIDGDRYDLRAWGSPAGWLRHRLMGERVEIDATLRPLGDAPLWMSARGLSGRGTVRSVGSFDVGTPHTRIANSIRRTIESGASSLDRDRQALFAGLVYGDDRQQSPLTADNFDAAGLTHLLAVSGQNVAFVLAIAGPILRRLEYRQRFVFVVMVLLLFATVTRFEPSVVRASVMTGVAAVASLIGTEVSSRRILGLAVTGLILVDPLIVHSVAFQLSVAASAGILLWSGRLARAIPGPRPVVESLAVTATAQLAVAPLLVWKFDGLPVASLPSNLLAGPAAGPVMMWGLTGGLVAGLVPAWLAAALHWPTRVALWWIDGVAAFAPAMPLGRLGPWHVVLLFVVGAVGLRQHARFARTIAACSIVVVLLHPAVVLATAVPRSQSIDQHSLIWRDDQVTIVELDAASRPQQVLAGLRHANIDSIDVVILHQSSFAHASLVRWMRTHHAIAQVWAPATTLGVGESVPAVGTSVVVEGFELVITRDENKLVVMPRPLN